MSNAPSKPVSFSRPKVGYFSNRPRMYLFNTTLFDGRGVYSIYFIRYNYIFRHLTMAIFRLYMKYLVTSYTGLIMGCIQ